MEGIEIKNGCYDDTLEVYNTLTDIEKKYVDDDDFEESPFTICRKVLYVNNNPVSFIEIIELPQKKNTGYVVAATNKDFRKNGYTKLLVETAKEEIPKNIDRLIWLYDTENEPSEKAAISLNFKKVKNGIYERKLYDN